MTTLSMQEIIARRERGVFLEKHGNVNNLTGKRVAVLCSFRINFLKPFLIEALERANIHATIYICEFGQVIQEITNPTSSLYNFMPQDVILIPAVEDYLPNIFARPSHFSEKEAENLVQERIEELSGVVCRILESLPTATCYVTTFGSRSLPLEYVLDPGASFRGQNIIELWIRHIHALHTSPRVVIIDWHWYCQRQGNNAFYDERLWYLGRMRLNTLGLATLADVLATYISTYYHTVTRKVLALDLDNTLWGGIIGEVGLKGIGVGEDGIGLAYQDFQRELLKLFDIGFLLTICSKNNDHDVWEVFDHHPGMVLRREHFAAVRVNWNDKVTNLLELADELALGTDSFVFIDDNPAERALVRSALPDVFVPELPSDPVYSPQFLRSLPCFYRLNPTTTDLQRSTLYNIKKIQNTVKEQASTIEQFIASLEQEVTLLPLNAGSLARSSEMCQRTNQFNLTTKRYTVADLEYIMTETSFEAYTLSVKDRFADNGITGLAILKFQSENATIDTFLLSCRILGRGIEEVLLSFLVDRARKKCARYLIGIYTPTSKNTQVAHFYERYGFQALGDDHFCFDLSQEFVAPTKAMIKVLGYA